MTSKVVIVDYGMGNHFSIKKKLRRLKVDAIVTSSQNDIENANKLILPGVGHFLKAMENIKKLHLQDVLNEAVLVKKTPILGICLGLQLLAKRSEEGNVEGLGWIDAEVVKFRVKDKLRFKIPHIGWNQVMKSKQSQLMKDIPDLSVFYFVHSYHLRMKNTSNILNETEYCYKFISAIEQNNIFGVQYHPEKSHDIGEILLKNFIKM